MGKRRYRVTRNTGVCPGWFPWAVLEWRWSLPFWLTLRTFETRQEAMQFVADLLAGEEPITREHLAASHEGGSNG